MQVDLDVEGASLDDLPRFQQSVIHARRLRRLAYGLGVVASVGLLLGSFVALFAPNSPWTALLISNAASLVLGVAGLQSAFWSAQWRARAFRPEPVILPALAPEAAAVPLGGYERTLERISSGWQSLLGQIGAPVLWLCGWSLLVMLAVQQVWGLSLSSYSLGQAGSLGAGVCLLLAFGLLVLERQFAAESAAQWPEAPALAQLFKVLIVGWLLSALCLLFSSEGKQWPIYVALLTTVLPGLVAAEWLIRGLLALFSPRRERLEPRLLARSLISDLLHWPPRPLQALQHELHNRFGIDLRQIWAFTYMRRAFLPVLMLVLGVGWLLSGVREIGLDGRGIYERFGKPVDVMGPGLHVGLPWPLGRVLAVENGVVHELATSVAANAEVPVDTAEGPAPASANRLWDASHTSEKSQVIASGSAGQQGFQIVNMDVRFVYRIGLTDQAALAATYNSADVPTLIRSIASRVLVHDFASRTLDGLLGEQRIALANDIGRAVQADLKQLDSGVELLATVVEAIHPPAGAANAYHGVQAAQINAQVLIARERGAASEQANQALLQASTAEDQARATSREVKAAAEAADLRFTAEQKAYTEAGQAFVLEQYLSQLSQGLSKARLLILDHRLGGSSAPTIDLRSFIPPVDPVAPSKTVHSGVAP